MLEIEPDIVDKEDAIELKDVKGISNLKGYPLAMPMIRIRFYPI